MRVGVFSLQAHERVFFVRLWECFRCMHVLRLWGCFLCRERFLCKPVRVISFYARGSNFFVRLWDRECFLRKPVGVISL